jgi:Tfp pilus assembly protein PilO
MYKRILAAAIIIIIAFAYVQWGMHYIYAYEWDKTAPGRDQLTTAIQNTRKIVEQPVNIDDGLSRRLIDLQNLVNLEQDKFPADVDITDVVDSLLHLAQDTGIEIVPLRNGEWTDAREKGYLMYQIQLLITGDADSVANFIDEVESKLLYSLNIDKMEMKGNSIGPAGEGEDTYAVDGYITVTIYRRA